MAESSRSDKRIITKNSENEGQAGPIGLVLSAFERRVLVGLVIWMGIFLMAMGWFYFQYRVELKVVSA